MKVRGINGEKQALPVCDIHFNIRDLQNNDNSDVSLLNAAGWGTRVVIACLHPRQLSLTQKRENENSFRLCIGTVALHIASFSTHLVYTSYRNYTFCFSSQQLFLNPRFR